MISKERKDFLWTVGALAVLIFVAMFGAYSGSHTAPNAECTKAQSAQPWRTIQASLGDQAVNRLQYADGSEGLVNSWPSPVPKGHNVIVKARQESERHMAM